MRCLVVTLSCKALKSSISKDKERHLQNSNVRNLKMSFYSYHSLFLTTLIYRFHTYVFYQA